MIDIEGGELVLYEDRNANVAGAMQHTGLYRKVRVRMDCQNASARMDGNKWPGIGAGERCAPAHAGIWNFLL